MKKFLMLTGMLLIMSIMCGPAMAEDEYRVGAIFSITGPASWLGEPERNTALMIVNEINANGGINGKKLKLYIEDDEANNSKALAAAKKLISKYNVCAIIGPSTSGCSLAIKPFMNESKIPLVSCAAAEKIISPVSESEWIFKTPQKDSDAARRIFEHMVKKGIKDIAIITGTTGFGSAGREQLKRLAPEYKINIVADETYGPKDTDMKPQLLSISKTKAKAIVNWSIVPAQSLVPKNMKELKLTIPLYQSHGFGNIKYVEAAQGAAEGVVFPAGRLLAVDTLSADNPQLPVLKSYQKAYETKFKDDVSTFGGHAYDAMWLVVNALKVVGDDPAKIRDHLESTKGFVGTGGIFNFSKDDHNGLDKNAFEMLIVKDGKFVVLKD